MNTPAFRITRADNLRDRIADALLSGELEPGSRLGRLGGDAPAHPRRRRAFWAYAAVQELDVATG